MKAYALGIYPRSPKLIEATRVNDPKLDNLFKTEKRKLIKLQIKNNMTLVEDPMLDWNDIFRPFVNVKGIELGALNRFFETNTFYRKLIINDELKGYGKIIKNNILLDELPANKAVVMPDPYTFAELNENQYYNSYEEYILAIAKMLNKEAQTLANEGVEFIQLNAPSIAYNANNIDDFNIIKEAIESVKKRVKSKIYLHLYFGNIEKILDKLLDIKVDGLSIDLINNSIDAIKEYRFKGLGLGIIDATNTKLEDIKMAKDIEDRLNNMNYKEAYLCTNTDLEFLPYEFAIKKISRLAAIAKKVKI
ncbi:MAG: 5-methyltetrahydropteroyltriglutamate--homocysteine methyltransferase [Candidatus Nitrosocaldaceae archaeon]|nr:MAG: 5-methyltetrahydropteroyltriglutamate--homocysteine methyltransferase [Candidatus Nitrosocaldaceae archaeon]